ncbi:MAG TPA: transaldolase [Gemmatimonadaceae bacterium]|nr:transaldolase [Gemmatimonadaceae bacterium]
MASSRLHALHDAGQSIWLDFIDRRLLTSGELDRRIRDEAITGMTSNPTIFEKALAEGSDYDEQLQGAPAEMDARERFELVATTDVADACDHFRSVYDATHGEDGYVSIEVAPDLAHDEEGTVVEARRLWARVSRPNVMIKVPGTAAGARATRRLIAEGVNVNITLLFSVEAYRSVIHAYLDGLEARHAAGESLERMASVASFFVSRVDTEVDARLEKLAAAADADRARALRALQGRAAVANARMAYALFQEMFAGARWEALAAAGARVQRPLWASTSTKNPAYRDVIYVEELIGPHTVNTMPPATITAFADHGVVERTVDRDVNGARAVLGELAAAGIDMNDVTALLLENGLKSFQKSFDTLLAQVERKTRALSTVGGEE